MGNKVINVIEDKNDLKHVKYLFSKLCNCYYDELKIKKVIEIKVRQYNN